MYNHITRVTRAVRHTRCISPPTGRRHAASPENGLKRDFLPPETGRAGHGRFRPGEACRIFLAHAPFTARKLVAGVNAMTFFVLFRCVRNTAEI